MKFHPATASAPMECDVRPSSCPVARGANTMVKRLMRRIVALKAETEKITTSQTN